MKRIKELFGTLREKLLQTRATKFSSISIKRDLILDIIDFAKANSPKEFVAVLEGKIKDSTLLITGVLYQPFQSSSSSAFMWQNVPMTSDSVGTVHSHPTPNNRPSGQDLRLFNKGGIVHLIIGYPFTEQTLACYDLNGRSLDFSID